MTTEIVVSDDYNIRNPKIVIHDTEIPNFEARVATSLVERWGMVAADDNGEDSTGRAKARLQTPEELVERACETSQRLAAAFRERKWFVSAPTWAEVKEKAKAQRIEQDKEYDKRR